MAKAPTEDQKKLAVKLDIDVPKGVSRFALGQLISERLEANRRDQRNDLPGEVASQRGTGPTSDTRRACIEALRASGIGLGRIVCPINDPDRHQVIVSVRERDILEMGSFILSSGVFTDFRAVNWFDGKPSPSHQLLYTPPAEFQHRLHAAYEVVRKDLGLASPFVKVFRQFADERLEAKDRFQNSYGEFWMRSAVSALARQFSEKRETEAQRRASKKNVGVPVVHCTHCGVKLSKYRDGDRCASCILKPLGAERCCKRCGTRFILEQGISGKSAILCPSHRGARTRPRPDTAGA